MPTVGY